MKLEYKSTMTKAAFESYNSPPTAIETLRDRLHKVIRDDSQEPKYFDVTLNNLGDEGYEIVAVYNEKRVME